MDFTEITLNDKPLFDSCLAKHNPQISELTFTNLFAWRHYYKFRYTIVNGILCLVSVPSKSRAFAMMPMGDLNAESFAEVLEALRGYFRQKDWKLEFRKITKEELIWFKDYAVSDTDVVYDRDNSDYVYLASDLATLRGKRFDGKRNHINKFRKNHTFEYIPLTDPVSGAGPSPEYIAECARIMDDWCRERKCSCQEGEYSEKLANMEILNNMATLGCKGAIIKVDGVCQAFTAGEMLNSDTAVIHIEKADPKIDGLYTLINQQFCEREYSGAVYINREQDLGTEGIRKAKLSYHPVKLIDKYTILL